MEHGTPTAYAAHRKAGEKPCEACRLDANRRSKESRDRKKQHKAEVLGIPVEPKAKKATSLRDYADALAPRGLDGVYTHQVVISDGSTFSIHKSEEEAQLAADRYTKTGTVKPFTPKPSTYWNSGDLHYDH